METAVTQQTEQKSAEIELVSRIGMTIINAQVSRSGLSFLFVMAEKRKLQGITMKFLEKAKTDSCVS